MVQPERLRGVPGRDGERARQRRRGGHLAGMPARRGRGAGTAPGAEEHHPGQDGSSHNAALHAFHGSSNRRRSPWTLCRPCAQPHRGCPQGGTVASTEIMPRQRCHNQTMKDAAPRLATRARQAGPAPRAAAVRMAAPARLAAGLAGAAVAAGALAVAEGPGRATTYAGSSAAGAALALSAGLMLIAACLIVGLGPGPRGTGDLALLAGLAWFAPVWAAWQDGPPLVPSLAMVAGGFAFPLVVHLVLAYPSGRVGSAPGPGAGRRRVRRSGARRGHPGLVPRPLP